ncbi:dioxygenase family protein [Amycolatopsis sp. H20-H5]|uniref:dioxygenase family protein n=1 Tax=Amycolatopsis sp. H20-H5 TaxID=3046309 RepID=UPI002DB9FF3C|nr:class III extradiol ring-cleavage dioxygenase [Amycolatopsis sp. H20-H5]MEC3974668.1 class III extradiol ring-cleavage dioxygenase [Amycolatopsis sp. H20-H5]
MSSPETQTRTPVLYLSHGAPPLADDETWTRQLAEWSTDLEKPKAILVVSAHWEEAPLTLGATTTVPLVYDFWGFPDHYYAVKYEAPGAPDLAAKVRKLLKTPQTPVHDAPDRGLDHGAYVPLVEMFPKADLPVLQISMPSLDPQQLFDLGKRLAPLRDEGVLIIGSGFFTHNLSALRQVDGPNGTPPTWSTEFDHWGAETLSTGDLDALLDFQHKAPAAPLAHPRTEHFAPLFVSLGASTTTQKPQTKISGYWHGLAKRSLQFS